MKNKTCVLLVLQLLFVLVEGLSAKERVVGTKLLIDVPVGFEKATQFPGYMMQSTQSSIMVTHMDGGSFKEVSEGFNRAGLATKKMVLLKKEKMKVGELEAFLIHASQQAYGSEYLKWMLVFGDASETVMVTATFPKQFQKRLSAPLKTAVLSSEWKKSLEIDFFEGLTFSVEEAGDLKVAKKMGNVLILTSQGIFPQKKKGDPAFVVGASLTEGWTPPSDKKAFAMKRLKMTKDFAQPKVLVRKALKIGGLEGYLIQATARIQKTGEEIFMEQCLLFSTDGYYLCQGLVAAKDKKKYQPVFRKILQSFRKK